MNELELMARLREEVPVEASPRIEQAIMTAIRAEDGHGTERPRRGSGLRRVLAGAHMPRGARMRPVLAGALAVAVGAGTYAGVALSGRGPGRPAAPETISWSGRPTAPWPAAAAWPATPSYGRAETEAQLVDYATRAAATARAPKPHEWVVVKEEYADSSKGSGGYIFGPADEREIALSWIRGDGCAAASVPAVPANLAPAKVVKSELRIGNGQGGPVSVRPTSCLYTSIYGWKNLSYSYLNSLPTDPATLEQIILKYDPPGGLIPNRASAIFDAIDTLLTAGVQEDGVVVPPKLEAAFYRILQQLPGVHFQSAVDLAGRTGLGFYMMREGYLRQEIVIDPVTYAYMGFEDVAAKDHAMTGTDGTRYVKKGHVMAWGALLSSAIVQKPGQLP